jgi:hypothetical protein
VHAPKRPPPPSRPAPASQNFLLSLLVAALHEDLRQGIGEAAVMRAERLHWQALSSVIPEPTLVALVTDLGRRPRQRLCAVGCPSYEGRGMKALLYARQRAGPIAAFVTGFVGFLLVYVFVIAGSASAPELRASTEGLRGAAAANAIRHMSGVMHMSLGKGCGGTRSSSNRHIVVTRSGGALCATGGTMYAELLAMDTPRAEIIRLLCQGPREFPRCDHGNSPPCWGPVSAGRSALMALRWRRMR